jgi:O-antigen/teichoic acid export membrane protein
VLPLFLALGLLNASNYIFHVAVSRLLGPSEYGTLAALLAVVMILSVPLSVAQTVVAKRVAILRADGRDREASETAAGTTKALLRVGVGSAVALAALSPLLADFLRAPLVPTALIAPYFLVSLLLSVPLGVLQGRLRFSSLAAVAILGVVVRLAVGIGLVVLGLGVTGALLGTVLAQALSLLIAFPLLRLGREVWSGARRNTALLRGEFAPALFALGAFWLLAEIDIVLARRFLDPDVAGQYAGGGLLARALLFLPAAISMVALPRFAEARDGDDARRRLRLALGAVLGLLLLAYPALILVRGFAVSLAFGPDFAPAASLIPLLAAGMGAVAVVGLLTHFHIAEGTRAYRLTFAFIAIEAVLITLFHDSPYTIGWIVLGVGATTALVQYHAAVAACRWRPAGIIDRGGTPLHEEGSLHVSVVLPCHNAGAGLRGVVEGVRKELEAHGSWEIIVVSDGSTDNTMAVAEALADEHIRVVHEPVQIGKGHALRVGLGQARGRFVAFMDSDGDIDPGGLGPALTLMDLYEPEVILASKRHPLSDVTYPPLRRVLSWTYHKICRVLFRVNVRDTQTGFKLIRRDVLAAVLPRILEKRYAFDLEFLVVARKLGHTRVFEAPVKIDYRFQSQVDPTAAFRILLDTLAIWYRRYILNTYSEAPAVPVVTATESNEAGLTAASGLPQQATASNV